MNDKGMRLSIILMTLALASCTREPDSAIVRQLEAAGPGDVRTASNDALLDRFRKHQHVGQETRSYANRFGRTRLRNGRTRPRAGSAKPRKCQPHSISRANTAMAKSLCLAGKIV